MQSTIEIISDVVCPWCFIGKRRLERALEILAREQQRPRIQWRPFQLNPQLPPAGVDRKTYVETKFGGEGDAKRIYARVANVGLETGIAFQFERIERQPNTIDAHRLIAFAQRHGKQDALVETLFRAFFLEGENIGDSATLAGLAERAGLDRAQAAAYLASEEGKADVQREDEWARGAGVSGVPFFLFNGKYAVSGAQGEDVLVEAYRRALAAA
jgi:predicted DsbA family dithiol-disulfide isomerase